MNDKTATWDAATTVERKRCAMIMQRLLENPDWPICEGLDAITNPPEQESHKRKEGENESMSKV